MDSVLERPRSGDQDPGGRSVFRADNPRAVNYVWEHSRAKATDLLVLLAIARHVNEDRQAFPSVETIARLAHTSERNVPNCLPRLEALGELHVQRDRPQKTAEGFRQAVNRYTLTLLPEDFGYEPERHNQDADGASLKDLRGNSPAYSGSDRDKKKDLYLDESVKNNVSQNDVQSGYSAGSSVPVIESTIQLDPNPAPRGKLAALRERQSSR